MAGQPTTWSTLKWFLPMGLWSMPTRRRILVNRAEYTILLEKKIDMGIHLFAALKGGGNNFGIVTAYTLQTHPQDHKVNRVQLYSFGVSKKHRYGEETISLQPIRRLKS